MNAVSDNARLAARLYMEDADGHWGIDVSDTTAAGLPARPFLDGGDPMRYEVSTT